MTIQKFTDLEAWKSGHKLVISIYILTNIFPSKETYSLIDQMRRAVVSVTSNIAEGFSRKGTKEKIQFYYLSLGSLTELENQLIISKDLKYISINSFNQIMNQVSVTGKLINGLIRSIKVAQSAP